VLLEPKGGVMSDLRRQRAQRSRELQVTG
jgi:hypothetical protein